MNDQDETMELHDEPIWTPPVLFGFIIRTLGLLNLVGLVYAAVFTIPSILVGGGVALFFVILLGIAWGTFGMYLLSGGQFFARIAYPDSRDEASTRASSYAVRRSQRSRGGA